MRIKISLPALEKVMKAEKVDQYKLKKLLINALIIRLLSAFWFFWSGRT